MKRAIVLGAGGFIGGHLVNRLKKQGYWVRGVDIKYHEFAPSSADEFIIKDLRDSRAVESIIDEGIDEVYQLAADMGGAGYLFTGENDAVVMHNSAAINLNVADTCVKKKVGKVFYSSSACVYPEYNQRDPDNPKCTEDSVYPADPDSDYGWEKLFSERLYLSYYRNFNLDVRIARFHNVYGPDGTWQGGREKAPAALCRKTAEADNGGYVEVWGDGKQSRSFMYIEDCLDGVEALMRSDFIGPVNIGSEEMITLNDFAKLIIGISGKDISIKNIPGPQGVRGRNSDNDLIAAKTGWQPQYTLQKGMERTYEWIAAQVMQTTLISD